MGTFMKALEVKQAHAARDTLCMYLYMLVFEWAAQLLNERTAFAPGRAARSIGILDVFGFESFDTNSLAQVKPKANIMYMCMCICMCMCMCMCMCLHICTCTCTFSFTKPDSANHCLSRDCRPRSHHPRSRRPRSRRPRSRCCCPPTSCPLWDSPTTKRIPIPIPIPVRRRSGVALTLRRGGSRWPSPR